MSRSKALQQLNVMFMLALVTGCLGSIYGWQVRTTSTPLPPSFNPAILGQEPVAILGALAMPGLHGNEMPLDYLLEEVLKKVAPQVNVVSSRHSMSQINQQGLAADYTQMRMDAEQSYILNREALKKIGTSIGARYVFQPRLAAFAQAMTDRWTFPALGILVMQTRSADLRVSLQLWDAKTGELLWVSMAEGTLQSEAASRDYVYFEDAARVALGSMIADFLNGKTASTYTPLNKLLDQLIEIPLPEKKSEQERIDAPATP
jgi:hypothetical protein